MAEKTEAPKPAPEKKDKPAEPKKAAAPAPAAPAAEKPEGAKSNKKINKMTAAEVQAKIEDIKSKQGGLRSQYARQLLHKKDLLKG